MPESVLGYIGEKADVEEMGRGGEGDEEGRARRTQGEKRRASYQCSFERHNQCLAD